MASGLLHETTLTTVEQVVDTRPDSPRPLQWNLQRLSGTSLDSQGAANSWAGTTGLDLLAALNHKNGTTGLGLLAVLNELAGTSKLGVNAAASKIEE